MSKGLTALLSAFADVFTMGRMVFYPLVGATIIVPLDLLARFALHEPTFLEKLNWRQIILMDLRALGHGGAAEIALLYFGSTVVGFLVAVAGFELILKNAIASTKSYASLHPHLRKDEIDYSLWLDAEYFRYAELSTYLPIGLFLGSIPAYIYLLFIGLPRSFIIPLVVAVASLAWLRLFAPRTGTNYRSALEELATTLGVPGMPSLSKGEGPTGNSREFVTQPGKELP